MLATLAPPILSVADPSLSAEGGIDPLGLAAINERLADRILPFVTVRMRRPRFLTAIAAGAVICDGLEDEVAADGETPAWLVYEWYVVEAFVRQLAPEGVRGFGLPGSQKVARSIQDDRRLGARSYLKTPKIFGFTGVYKTLGVGLDVIDDELRLAEAGYDLVRAWQAEQRLAGFADGTRGAGAQFRAEIRRAVEDGLERGYTARPPKWQGWSHLALHLHPSKARRLERGWLHRRLTDPALKPSTLDSESALMRSELLGHLAKRGGIADRADEAPFFRALLAKSSRASPSLRHRLALIDSFEALSRPIEDALRLILHLSGKRRGDFITLDTFRRHRLAPELAKAVPVAIRRVGRAYEGSGWEREVDDLVARYGDVCDSGSLFATVLDHHETVQRAKPPDGKRPWIERYDPERVAARPQYFESDPPPRSNDYVRDYRTNSATQFLRDLGCVP